jgi:hypothetical protein
MQFVDILIEIYNPLSFPFLCLSLLNVSLSTSRINNGHFGQRFLYLLRKMKESLPVLTKLLKLIMEFRKINYTIPLKYSERQSFT